MATQFPDISKTHRAFIKAQHLFFVGTAAQTGRVDVSPKGVDSLRVLGPNRIIWRNLAGSGNETAGHLQGTNRIALMWCSFDRKAPDPARLRDCKDFAYRPSRFCKA